MPTGEVVSCAGVTLPGLVYGTAWKKERTEDLVLMALTLGFRGVDTAGQPKHYDEAGVGRGIARFFAQGGRREDLYIQTKFTPLGGHDPRRIPYDPAAPLPAQVAQSFRSSLSNLQVDVVDGLLLHSPLPVRSDLRAAWQALEAIAEAGGARQIGISNCYDPGTLLWLCEEARVKPAVVQNRFYAETGHDRDIRRICRERGMVYQSFWTLTANPELLASPAIREASRRHGRTPAQVLFRYLSQRGVVPLTGTTSERHAREDLAIFEFTLDDAETAAIDALL